MVPLARRTTAVSVRGGVWALVLAAFLFGAAGASVLFVGVWRHEASRASSADVRIQEAAQTIADTKGKLRSAQARLARQVQLLDRLRAATKPIVVEAGAMGSASQQLASESAALRDTTAKLTNAVDVLSGYLKGTSLVELDPAYVDNQLAYLEQQLGAIQARSAKLASGSKRLVGSRDRLARRVDALARLAR